MPKWIHVAAAALIIAAASCIAHAGDAGFDERVASTLAALNTLRGKGVNVDDALVLLDKAVKAAQAGDTAGANGYLSRVEEEVRLLEAGAWSTYIWGSTVKYLTVAVLAVIPVAVYTLLPRLYVYAWYRLRRKWVVRR